VLVDGYVRSPGARPLPGPALLDEVLPAGQTFKRFVPVPPGRYYLILDHSDQAGHILGASSGAAFAALSPAMTAVMAIPILGEWPTAMDWIAIAGISAGVYVVSGGPLPQRRT
jgi:hypothetical protein